MTGDEGNPDPAIVLVTGVAVIDFVFRLDRLPDRPEKYRANDAAIVGGGCAANAAVAIARLGGKPLLACRLGNDAVGDLIVKDLVAEAVDCTLARRFDGFRSSYSSVIVTPGGERQIVNFRDSGLSFDAAWLAAAMPAKFDAALADSRWPKGALEAMQTARDLGVPAVMDAEAPIEDAGPALGAASHVAFSAQGLRDFSGCAGLEAGLAAAGARLDAWLCVTDGENGVYYREKGELRNEPAYRIDAVDTLGAGDVWHGAFALRLGEGAAELEAIRFANAVAALKCTIFGGRAGTPDRQKAEAFMKKARHENRIPHRFKEPS